MSYPKPAIPKRIGLQRIFVLAMVLALMLTPTLGAAPTAYAAPKARPVAEATATSLTLVEVAAPAINCLFDADCTITVDDQTANFLPPAATGDAFLQSRLWPVGEAGTNGAALYPYLYRIDLRNAVGLTAAACVTEMSLNFGPVAAMDYNGDAKAEHIFVVTKGGLGNVKPIKAIQDADKITFYFDPAVCVGASRGKGDSSFFFGLASKLPPQTVPARLVGTLGLDTTLRARAPKLPTADIAYVFDSDTASASAFQAFLGSEGYSVQLIHLNDVLATNFSLYKLIIIGNDTGDLDTWGNAALQAEQIGRGGRPVIGVGNGGYAFFGKSSLPIGWANGWHGTQKEVMGDVNLPYYQFPYDLTALLPGPLALYNNAVDEVGIHLPSPVAGVIPLGREVNDETHYPLIAQQLEKVCHQLWGFAGNPRAMTISGQQLFANAVRYGLNTCPPAQQQPVIETPELPIFNQKEQTNVEILQADNTVFAAVVDLPQAQLWPVKASDGKSYTELAVPGVDLDSSAPGQPGVPVIRRILAIPRGAKVHVAGVDMKVAKRMDKVLLLPAQPEPVDALHQQENPGDDEMPAPETFMDKPFTIDEKAYASAEPFPAQVVSVQPLGRVRDLDLVQLSIASGQYIPAKQHLALFDKVHLEIKFEGGEGGFLPRTRMDNPFDNHAQPLYELALNYRIVEKYPFPGDLLPNLCWGYEYLIVTDPAFRTAADNLRTWKIQKGISTKVVETGNDAGDAGTTKEQIQQYIRNQFNNCIIRPSYVLLLGDAEHINPFYRNTNSGGNAGTDLDYALMDNADILPDLAIGRIPVDTLDQANTVINKIINYEKSPPFAPTYYRSLSFASYFQCCRNDVADDGRTVRSFIETSELVRDELTGLGYSVERIYTTDTSYHPEYVGRDATPRKYRNGAALPAALAPGSGFAWDGNTEDIVNAFNDGRFLVFHRDHGWSGGWGDPRFATGDIDDLTNGSRPSVVYSVNCASGLFDNETNGGNVNGVYWAEKLLRHDNGGAVGIIGDTRNSPTWANSALSRGLFDATWPGVVPEGGATSIRRLGDILNYGKSYLAGQVGVAQTAGSVSQTSANDDIILYHVYGDPTMQMWTSNPWFIRLPKLYEIVKFDPTIWQLRYPMEGVQLTLLQDGVPVARGTVRNGQVALPILDEKFDPDKPYELSASDASGVSVLLDVGRATGGVTPEQGGTLQDEAGRVTVAFPAGAVDQPTTLILSDVIVGRVPGGAPHVRRFTLEAVGENGDTVAQFGTAYAMQLPYTDEELQEAGLDEKTLRCQWLDETTHEWQPVASSVDSEQNILTCQADHFTEFAVTGDALMAELPANQLFLPLVTK
ncbi:MAG: hypothetical protein KF832_25650 [Caldilineaceae bacterium]|nr:hypothetical protein [Caldilineaceae bacterium]